MKTVHFHSADLLKMGMFLKTLDFWPTLSLTSPWRRQSELAVNLGGGSRRVTLSPVFFSPSRSLPFSAAAVWLGLP